ncbi:type I restriction-modification system subunit M [Thermocrinis minervae]|uniref:site-specific DNA-methyltransferase (adenine-specific) n=1 Tax=Thermocrinis minervae TaxID=381751 RepID=A0A1M6STB5_9AQUI|nr:class I SAM-dependent DNA methyltransferase [Thermocrinis minervae]SHK47870.1 type I restriction enzyme M protein [Thermocrinis minervae]
MHTNNHKGKLDIKTLENWLWEAACKIRGEIDAPKYKDYILPLIFIKRLSDVFEDEVKLLSEKYGNMDPESIEELISDDRKLVRFYLPKEARWEEIRKHTENIGEYLTDVVRKIAKENPELHGVVDMVDFNATVAGQRIISDESLKALIEVLSRHRLGIEDVDPDILGRAYEYLIKKFAEGSGQSAGEFYTPGEVATLMALILDPQPGNEIYDPCCGSGGLLIKCHLRFKEKYGNDTSIEPVKFYGQEINPTTYAMAKMNVFIHDMEAEIALGDTMKKPAFLNPDGSLKKFDLVVANPMWNQNFEQSVYENDPYDRFTFGYPPSNTADWGWIQHMFASLKDKGKMAVVLDTGAVSRGSGTSGKNRERDIRKAFVDNDYIEAVILLPENLFYNTTAPGIIIVINKAKPEERKNQILLINASKLFEKGRPKNYLPEDKVKLIADLYSNWKEENGISKIISKEEAIRNDYNLSPSRYVGHTEEDDILPLEDAIVQLRELEEERKEVEEKLEKILKELGLIH